MFTGIIQEIGTIRKIDFGNPASLTINAPKLAQIAYLGGSISVNGTCLSVTRIEGENLSFDAIPETIQHTNLSMLKVGDFVNLEPAMKADSRFDGHLVQGHIDETGKIIKIDKNPGEVRIRIQTSSAFHAKCIHKGSVAINGISLTIARLFDDSSLEVAIIPTSLADTNLKYRRIGDIVNLESDVMLKYVEQILRKSSENNLRITAENSKINENWLRELGY